LQQVLKRKLDFCIRHRRSLNTLHVPVLLTQL